MAVSNKELSPHLQKIVDEVFPMIEQITGVTLEMLKKGDRRRFVVDARKILVNILREHAKLTCMQAAKIIDKDHTTVVHYEKLHKIHMIEPEYRRMYSAIAGMYALNNNINVQKDLTMQFNTLHSKTKILLNSLEKQCKIMEQTTTL